MKLTLETKHCTPAEAIRIASDQLLTLYRKLGNAISDHENGTEPEGLEFLSFLGATMARIEAIQEYIDGSMGLAEIDLSTKENEKHDNN